MTIKAVFPAYAGMSPASHPRRSRGHRFPRLRGDEPVHITALVTNPWFSPPTRG